MSKGFHVTLASFPTSENFYVLFHIGEGPEYRPFRDLRFVPKFSRLKEQVEIAKGHILRSFSYI
jgi:hypothetical protein